MKLDEVRAPGEMKQRLETAKLEERVQALEDQVALQADRIGKLQKTVAALIGKLGPKA